MAKGGKSRAGHRADARGKQYAMLPHAVLDSPAYRDLSLRARSILIGLVRRFNGFNNNSISYSAREMAADLRTGAVNYGAISRAVVELIEHGFIDVSATHRKAERLAREYRLTFVSYGPEGVHRPATNEYLSWAPDGNSGAYESSAEAWKPAHQSSAGGKRAAYQSSADTKETPHVSVTTSADHEYAHIITTPSSEAPPCFHTGKIGGKAAAAISDPLPHEDIFMDADDLRQWVAERIDGFPGAQTRLAIEAKVPGGTLSKFLSGRGLNRAHRVSVQQALPRVVAAARMNAASNG